MDDFSALELLNDARKLADLKYATHEQLDKAYEMLKDKLQESEREAVKESTKHLPHAPLEIPEGGRNESWN